jgi:hypothetical protein
VSIHFFFFFFFFFFFLFLYFFDKKQLAGGIENISKWKGIGKEDPAMVLKHYPGKTGGGWVSRGKE